MMNNVALKFAASTLVLGLTMVACKPAADMSRPRSASARDAKSDQAAARLAEKAQVTANKGDFAAALGFAEQAVEMSPRDVGYRMVLADLYLKNGRFTSAETSFSDVLALDAGNVRAGMNRALVQIALGRPGEAIGQLESLSGAASPADLGLAFALAGQPQRAIEMLEPAARAADANGRVRQNLALAYALSGDWQKARVIAAQDVSPTQLGARMEQWASFSRPSAPWDQVASLLGVTPVEDAGQPVRLALAPAAPDASAYAAVEAAPEFEPAPAIEARVQVAEAEAPAWVPAEAPVEIASVPAIVTVEAAPEPSYVSAVEALVTPEPAVVRMAVADIQPVAPTFAPARRAAPRAAPRAARPAASGPGRYVVQLGAFSSAAGVERAWAGAYRRYGLGNHQPRSTTVRVAGKAFHRLSVAGFNSRADASRICQSVRAKGGVCFVRAVAGDSPVRWASRYTSRRSG